MKQTAADTQASHSTMQARQVHTITDRFSMVNTYVLADDEALIVVDPGSVQQTQLLYYYIRHFLHRQPAEIDLIVLTHLDRDHSAGVKALQHGVSIPVAALKESVQRQQDGIHHESRRRHLVTFTSIYERQAELVDVWLEDVAGLPAHPHWRVFACPGRIAGNLCLYNPFTFEFLCGDAMANRDGRIFFSRNNVNRIQMEETLQALRSMHIHYLYPSYGRPLLSLYPLRIIEIN